MSIKMIVTDLDGTLLRKDETLSQRSIDIIKHLQSNGIIFVIATSRSFSSVKRIAALLNPDAVISSGGAHAVIGSEVVYEALISPQKASQYIEKCLREPAINYIRVIGEKVDLTNNSNVAFGEMEFGHYKRTDFNSFPQQKVYKISICSTDVEKINEMFGYESDCQVITSYAGENCHKLTHIKATKEDALLRVAQYFGVTYKNIMAFGDDISDIMMLSLSEKGIAVNNALPCVKEVANDICDENEDDGVAKYLLENLLMFVGGE